MDNDFFSKPKEHSIVKAKIVSNYFEAWANVIIGSAKRNKKTPKLTYIDLFCGPGRYEDGTESTPLLVLKKAILRPEIRESLSIVFNDICTEHIENLKSQIAKIPGIEQLRYKPQVFNENVGRKIIDVIEMDGGIPAFLFVDPNGYKGLSLELLGAVIRRWGSDSVFFFNYLRVNMNLPTQKPTLREPLMREIFGATRFKLLRTDLDRVFDPDAREQTIIRHLRDALKDIGGKYALDFAITDRHGARTQQYLIYVTKSAKGLTIMKDIMGGLSTQQLPGFGYSSAMEKQFTLLPELCPPEDELAEIIAKYFSGRSVTAGQVYSEHGTTTSFRERDYKAALKKLEFESRVAVDPPVDKRKRGTFPDNVSIKFPKLG